MKEKTKTQEVRLKGDISNILKRPSVTIFCTDIMLEKKVRKLFRHTVPYGSLRWHCVVLHTQVRNL